MIVARIYQKLKTEIYWKYLSFDTSDSNNSEGTVFCIEPINTVTKNFFSDTDVLLYSTSAPPVSEINSKYISNGSTKQTPQKC